MPLSFEIQTQSVRETCDSTITLDLTLNYTGIVDQKNSIIIVSPNPANDFLIINTPEQLIEKAFTIIDLNGKIIKHGILTQKKQKIEIGALSERIYMFKISNENNQTFRILKN